MRIDVPLVLTAVFGATHAAAGMSSHASQPTEGYPADEIQLLETQISRLEQALEAAFSQLATLYDGYSPSSVATLSATSSPASTTSITTKPLLNPEGPSSSRFSLATSTSTATFVDNKTTQTPELSPTTTNSLGNSSNTLLSPSGTTNTTASSAPSANGTSNANGTMASTNCASLCRSLTFPPELSVQPISCSPHAANSTITIQGGQATATCGSTIKPEVDLCRVVLTVTTSNESSVYMEVWLPDGNSTWNGRTMSTDNSGVNGCVAFDDMQYVTGLGFAAVGDNGGHNGSSFDGSWFQGSNELVLDWAGRARHASIVAGKAVARQFYDRAAAYSYYIGCSAGGSQGMKSAQDYPEDFDGIIAGSPAADFNHLQAWSGRFVQLTGTNSGDPRFLTQDDWISVQSAVFAQCDEALDGVADGILEDPTICQFNASILSNSSYGLTATQIATVRNVFTELYNTQGNLVFPALLYGSQVDAFRLGQLSGSIQAISEDWYKYAVLNDSNWDPIGMDQTDYARADALDAHHGNVSGYNGDLSAFRAAGGKLMIYHGMADPLVSEGVSQRYYLKVARTLGISNTGMDDFMRLFRISGMAHCSVAGISGAGAWMFGQNEAAADASHNIIQYLQDWVEHGVGPDYITGTKFWYDTPSRGVAFERNHCKFPYRTTYVGGDYTRPSSWNCTFIEDWQECGVGAHPRLCNVDGTFDP